MLPTLRTKITIPPTRPRVIERARLLAAMAEGARRALTVVEAPAGFGKTTLVAAWAQSGAMPAAWLSLQPADRPPERFLTYLIQALQAIAPQLGQTTLALLRGASPEGALFALVNDLAEVEHDFALILDDYHTVDSPEVAVVVQFLLENRPAAFHLLITTRVAPALNLARLRALDQVTEIGAADLRFTPAEMADFLRTSMGLELSAPDLANLDRSTEGWAVGLQLAALALARRPANGPGAPLSGGPGPGTTPPAGPPGQAHIFDYLAEEVLRREPPPVQSFLKRSALFDRFCAPLCAALLDPPDGAPGDRAGEPAGAPPGDPAAQEAEARAMLAYLDRANLFLTPLDAGATWFRYHALFADFLRRQVPDELARPLYHRASAWFEENGLADDAIHYAVHAGDYERSASLIEDHYIAMLQRGDQNALAEWIAALPAEFLERRPRLWLAKGWASIIALDSVAARACADRAEAILLEALIPRDQAASRLLGEAKSLRILSVIFAGQAVALEEISATAGLLSEQDGFLHSLLHFNLGLNHVMRGETAQAIDALNDALRLTQALNNPLVAIVAQVQLGETRQMRGALGLSERTFQGAIRYTQETLGEHSFLLGMPYVSYADLLRETNRFAEAREYAEKGIAYCYIWQPVASMDGQIALARLLAAQGDWAAAYHRLEQARQAAVGSVSLLDDTFVAIQQARLLLLQGDLEAGRREIRLFELDRPTGPQMYYHLWELTQLVLYRAQVMELAGVPALGASADPAPANAVIHGLSELLAAAESRERVTSQIEALILRAYAQERAGLRPAAAESLAHALALGAQSGYVRIFADEGEPLLRLLESCRDGLRAPRHYLEQIRSLLAAERVRPAHSAGPADSSPSGERLPEGLPEGLTPLTRRELDILALLAAGKSNQEIAAERVLALNTVKKHVANILSKLGVANRTQAVMLAKKLGWLD